MSDTIQSIQANVNSYLTVYGTDPNYTHVADAGMTPPQISTAYNMPASNGAGVKVGVISLGGGFLQSDLNSSLSDIGLTAPTIRKVLLDGASGVFNPSDNGSGENTLDLYCVAGLVPSANISIYISGGILPSLFADPVYAASYNAAHPTGFANAVQRAIDDNVDVISISWGYAEKLVQSGTSYYLGDFLANTFANAAAKGITVVVASGDNGSEPTTGTPLTEVQYPGSSPNIISVGGTHLSFGTGNVRASEVPESHAVDPGFPTTWGGGGGLSTYVPVPSWQSGLTYRTYQASTNTTGSPTSLTYRGVPDIAGPMNAYGLYMNGSIGGFGGTSAAAPMMAGMIARYVALTGKRPTQPLGPLFYGNTTAFYDITTGNNDTNVSIIGYASTVGWDPVTGLGAPYSDLVYNIYSNAIGSSGNVVSTGSNIRVKTDATTWANVTAVYVKTDATTWRPANISTKTNSTTWQGIF